nr:hypothetical protein [uncultured Psychroserpens sp.]
MKVFILPFGKINLINSRIAEVIINDGITLDKLEVQTYHKILKSHLDAPFSVLINKENGYSYTFDAQLEMGKLKEIVSRAVVVYNQSAEMATKIIMNLNEDNKWNIKLFKERQAALDWLLVEANNRKAM